MYKQTLSGKLLCNREPSRALCDNLEGWDGGRERREVQEGGDIYI